MTDRQRHDCAVAFCCDQNYLHLALFMIWQIAHHNPWRRFDFVISSRDDLVVPDWAAPYGIVLHKTGPIPAAAQTAVFQGSFAPIFRLMLARELGGRYRRILYLDCDMFVEAGDLNRLLEVDLGPHPLAAVLDAPQFYSAEYRAREFEAAGLPAQPYLNSGLQLIDTAAYVDQNVEQRCLDACKAFPGAIVYPDQSMLNLALQGKFAQLAPCWNWQVQSHLPLIPLRYPVFLTHFIGTSKPDRSTIGLHGARFNHAYREFLTNYIPDKLPSLAGPSNPAPLPFKAGLRYLVRHVLSARLMSEVIARHPDPYKAIL